MRLLVAALLSCVAVNVAAQTATPETGTPQNATPQAATPMLWRDPGAIPDKDLQFGPGSADRAPQPPFTFVKEDMGGSKPKVHVTDAQGVQWNVKLAGPDPQKNEVHAEVAANRVLWALGYGSEENYFMPKGRIDKVGKLERADSSIGRDGTFRLARFERRDSTVTRSEATWTFEANPFVDTKELSGLKLLIALMHNWDNKYQNTAIDRVTTAAAVEDWYLFSDWGAAFGRMSGPPGWSPAPTRWRPADYTQPPFIKRAGNGVVSLNYRGQVPMGDIPIDHARWFLDLVGQLNVEQLRTAFSSAGASPQDADAFAHGFLEKVEQLRSAVASSAR